MREGLALSNPVANTNKRDEQPRDRVLSNDEIRRIWNAAGDDAYGTIVKLLILTGQRRSEIAELRWSEVDFGAALYSSPASALRTGGRMLSRWRPPPGLFWRSCRAMAREFSSPRPGATCKDELDKRSGVAGWVIHDIRRSVATGMADIGIAPHIIEAVLNHVSGHKGGVAGIYNRSSYAAEKAAALARWDEHVASIVGGAIMTEAVTRYKNCVEAGTWRVCPGLPSVRLRRHDAPNVVPGSLQPIRQSQGSTTVRRGHCLRLAHQGRAGGAGFELFYGERPDGGRPRATWSP